jgi:hypothetical protein
MEETVIGPRKLVLLVVSILAIAPLMFSTATNVYITPNGTSQGNCSSNPQAPAWFNSAANWGSGSSQIGPGTTVLFCGTFTDVVNGILFTARGSGASGNPVTLKFDTGTVWQSPAENTFLILDGQSNFIVDGGTTCGWVNLAVTNCNGQIENTANGTNFPNKSYGSAGISASGSSNIEIRNLQIGPIYVKVGTGDQLNGAPGPQCVRITNPSNSGFTGVNIHNNIMHDVGWCVWGGVNNLTIANNEIYYLDHGLGFGNNTDGTSTWSGMNLHDNHLHDFASWDTSSNDFHHDGFHFFAYAADGTDFNTNNTIKNINIYNNLFNGDFGNNNTANIFFEGNIQNANIFNNISIVYTGRQLDNGIYNGYGTNVNFLNNTVLGPGNAYQSQKYSIFTGPGFTIKNNAYTDGGTISVSQPFPNDCPGYTQCQTVSYAVASNAYMAPADFSNGFGSLSNGFYNFNSSGFAGFESDTKETGGIFKDSTEPNGTWFNTSTGAEIAGSPTVGAGTNLASLCTQNGGSLPNALCSDIAGNLRPGVGGGKWDIGAYNSTSDPPPAPPTGLSAVVE